MKQKKLTVHLCFWMVLVLILPLVSAHAATDERSGAVTDSISWELTEEGILYIHGEGEIPDYGYVYVDGEHQDNGPAPWKEAAEEIKELVIEEGITRIGESAFDATEELGPSYSFTKVSLPASLESVGHAAFETAYAIEKVYIPSLRDWCEIAFEALNPQYHFATSSNPAFRADLYIGGELLTGKVIFPEKLTKVNDLTFAGREGLTEVVLHDGVKELGNASFYESKDLQFVNLPEGIESIPYEAFARCHSLNGFTLPQTVEEIGYAAFFECAALQEINIPAAVKESAIGAFAGCDSLNAVHITDIDAWSRIVFGLNYTHPHFHEGASPLYYAKNLYLNGELVKEVTIPEDVTDLSDLAFAGCTSLEKIILPEGLVVIGEEAFKNCTSLKEINIPSTVKAVQGYAFDGCSALEKVYITSAHLIACRDYKEQWMDEYGSESVFKNWNRLSADLLIPQKYDKSEVGLLFEERYVSGITQSGDKIWNLCSHAQTTTEQDAENCKETECCVNCGKVFGSNTAHAESVWVEATPATYDAPGMKELRCTVCQTVLETEEIPQLENPKTESSEETSVEESSMVESSEEESVPEEESTVSEESEAPAESSASEAITESSVDAQPSVSAEAPAEGSSLWIILVVAAGVAVVAVAVILLIRRK